MTLSAARSLWTLALGALLLAARAGAAPPMLHVAGTRLADAQGRTVRLQGVNIPSLEWTSAGEHVPQSVDAALGDWHARLIRLPLCQDRWFGKAVANQFSPPGSPGQAPVSDGGAAYRRTVDAVVQQVAARNAYVLLDLHWSDGGVWGQDIGQHVMPDDNSVLFWKSLAARYANNPAVFFDLYNEPHDVSWDVWQRGGAIDEHNDDPTRGLHLQYHSPGMQAVLDAVRATGARNVVVAGGTDWAYDLSGLLTGHALTDPRGRGILYATHIYPWKKDWDVHVTPASEKYAVYVGEVGVQPWRPSDPAYQKVDPAAWAPQVLAYIQQHRFNWTAWSFHPGAGPCVITGWDYRPTPFWGVYVKAALAGQPLPAAPATPPAPVGLLPAQTPPGLAPAEALAGLLPFGATRAAVERAFPQRDGGLQGATLSRYYAGGGAMVEVPFDDTGGPWSALNRVTGPIKVYAHGFDPD